MDESEETRDVFTVSVGNLPPRCTCVVKIVYVAELASEGGAVVFRLPASLAPRARAQALRGRTQGHLATSACGAGDGKGKTGGCALSVGGGGLLELEL